MAMVAVQSPASSLGMISSHKSSSACSFNNQIAARQAMGNIPKARQLPLTISDIAVCTSQGICCPPHCSGKSIPSQPASEYSLNTNGTLITPRIAKLLCRRGNKLVAIYGATAEVHDRIIRMPGSFEAVMQGCAYLREAGAGFPNASMSKWSIAAFERQITMYPTLRYPW